LATWKLLREKKLQQDRSEGKAILALFIDTSGTVHVEFIPEGAAVNKHRYKEMLRHLCSSVHLKHPEVWRRNNWLLLHDVTPAHLSELVQEKLVKQQVPVLPPHFTLYGFLFFPRLKEKLCGRRSQLAKEIITATREAIRDLP
jgi:hypothetical protein